ncbi:cytochrome oxidase c assembly-domain-containing protein [Chaetomidium leptoderma]|uniref:Cytochrome oxidase c assembly-domain-containing protein n=1 Tax=Chaetomidium leptoderma TaxID=669021 RepID=A0AAN6VQT8_9PEZI|nr:cytochrome oxidase c assembly-domain-containing protein [Chaetomidium leptoderma]
MKRTMRLCAAPRTVSDATRFTATTLHASSKTATPPPRFSSPSKSGSASSAPGGGGGSHGGPSPRVESPDQKVARLRAAHRRAKEAEVSRFDKVVNAGRRVFDSAHKVTVVGLIGFTVIAGFATAYTAVDMMMYNKKRGREWVEAQKKLEADSLEAARIAYMTGKATEEQIALVEDQLAYERESGRKTSFFSDMPSVLGAPEAAGGGASSSSSSPPPSNPATQQQPPQQQDQDQDQDQPKTSSSGGVWSWLTSNLKREEEADSAAAATGTSQRRLGYESLSEEDDSGAGGVRDSDIVRALEDKARAALDHEKANQRQGGPLDRVGVIGDDKGVSKAAEAEAGEKGKKKGWFW